MMRAGFRAARQQLTTLLRPGAAALALALLGAAAPLAAQSAGGGSAAPSGRSIQDGVYTEEQGRRGEQVFRTYCTTCHTAADFTGQVFVRRWSTVGSLFDVVSTTMPGDVPGSLTPQQYADVIAYFLRQNNLPAGQTELPAELEPLEAIRMAPPGR